MSVVEIIFSLVMAGLIILLYWFIKKEPKKKYKYYIGCDIAEGDDVSVIAAVRQYKSGAVEFIEEKIIEDREDFEDELTKMWEKYNKCTIMNEIPKKS